MVLFFMVATVFTHWSHSCSKVKGLQSIPFNEQDVCMFLKSLKLLLCPSLIFWLVFRSLVGFLPALPSDYLCPHNSYTTR